MCRLGKNSLCRFVGLTFVKSFPCLDCDFCTNTPIKAMSDLASLIKSFESCGFSTEEAKVEAKAERERAERERERACELFYCYFILALFHYQIFQTIWNMRGSSWNRSNSPE